MRSPEAFGVNKIEYRGNVRVTTTAIQEQRVRAGSTAKHEARHAVAAVINGTRVRSVTIRPGPGYLGRTELANADPVAAAASYATGRDGGEGGDEMIVFLIGNKSSEATARGIILRNQEKVEAVASKIEEKETLSGGEVEAVMQQVDEQVENVIVTVENLDRGTRITEKTKAKKGIVVFDSTWIEDELALAA
jgi:hypothetical protein